MSEAPRARTRTRQTTTEDTTETKASGRPVSERATTDHAPAANLQVLALPDGLIARISVRDGVTLNMGNFNSFRRDIGLELDIPLDSNRVMQPDGQITNAAQAILDAAYESAQEWVSDRIEDAVKDAQQFFEG